MLLPHPNLMLLHSFRQAQPLHLILVLCLQRFQLLRIVVHHGRRWVFKLDLPVVVTHHDVVLVVTMREGRWTTPGIGQGLKLAAVLLEMVVVMEYVLLVEVMVPVRC